jgi:hypothetical protein
METNMSTTHTTIKPGSPKEFDELNAKRNALYKKLCPGETPWAYKQKYDVRVGVRELIVFAEDEAAAKAVKPTFESVSVRVVVFPHMNAKYGDRPSYKDKDLAAVEFQASLKEAKELWNRLCSDYVAFIGEDGGSFTSGAGIAINHVPPRCRNHQTKNVIEDYEAFPSQRCAVHEATRDEVIALLSRKGIVAFWNCGWSA